MTARRWERAALSVVMVLTGAAMGAMAGGTVGSLLGGIGALLMSDVVAHDYMRKE